jgi:hypothetical protein
MTRMTINSGIPIPNIFLPPVPFFTFHYSILRSGQEIID